MAPWTLSVIKEILNPPMAGTQGCVFVSNFFFLFFSLDVSRRVIRAQLTCIDGCDDALHNDDRQSVQASQESDNLTDSRQLRHHVEKQGEECHATEIDSRDGAIALSGPLGENKTFRTLASDNRTKRGEDEER